MNFRSIMFLALAATACCQVAHAQKYIAEGYFVVESNVLDKYLSEVSGSTSLITRRATAKANLKKDIDYVLTGAKKLLDSLTSKGLELELRVRELVILSSDIIPASSLISGDNVDATTALNTFDSWLESEGAHAKLNYDFAILYTGYDLHGNLGGSTAGFAHVGTVCDPKLATGVVEFNATYLTATVTAHEIGHILGSNHDGANSQYIMAAFSNPVNTKRWDFSTCSVSSIEETMSYLSPNCLLTTNSATKEVDNNWSSHAGRLLDPNFSCQKKVDHDDSYMCLSKGLYDGQIPKGDVVCQKIYCRIPGTNLCSVAHTPEGMVCDVNKRCIRGECVVEETSPAPGVDATCPLGDQKQLEIPSMSFVGTCQDYIKEKGPPACYGSISQLCCATCNSHSTGRPSCMYGDKSSQCKDYPKASVCPNYGDDLCCGYCHGFKRKRSVEEGYEFQVTLTEDVNDTKLFLEEDVKVDLFLKKTAEVVED